MASFPASLPLPVLGSSRSQSGPLQKHLDVEYEQVPQAPEDSSTQQIGEMGYEEQILKPERRPGDVAALYAACVRVRLLLTMIPHC